MLNEVEELLEYAILKTVLLHACLKWQQRQDVQRILYFTCRGSALTYSMKYAVRQFPWTRECWVNLGS